MFLEFKFPALTPPIQPWFRCSNLHVAEFPACDKGLHGCPFVHGCPPPPGQCGEYFPMFSFFPYCFQNNPNSATGQHGESPLFVCPFRTVLLPPSPPQTSPPHRLLLAVEPVRILLIPACACP